MSLLHSDLGRVELMCSRVQVMMIAAHPWDIHGALAAGLRATYVDRPKIEYPPYYIKPDFIIPSLKELADLPIGVQTF